MIEARAFIDGSIKKLAPMFLGSILILCQNAFIATAFALVLPIGYAALASSFGLMPLVLRLAQMVEAPKGAGASSMV